MFLGLDDTDSRTSGCTTYIGFRIAAHYSNMMKDFPRLVRLNPNLPYKTRGNGAVSLTLGKCGSHSRAIGSSGGETIFICDDNSHKSDSAEQIVQYTESVVRKFYVPGEENTNPGIVVMGDRLPEKLYRMALELDVCVDCVRKLLKEHGANYIEIGNGRGIIGAAASIAWPGKRHTYELLSYHYPRPMHIPDRVKSDITHIAKSVPSTFNNDDDEKTCLFPRERTPVIYGIRGTNSEDLMKIQKKIGEEYPEFSENYIIYKSNQGTDDHIIPHKGERLQEYSSYSITGRISTPPERRRGGHLYFSLISNTQTVNCIVFEPSKNFRDSVEKLEKNDLVTVYGSYGLDHMKIEKIKIVSRSMVYLRKPPLCVNCGKIMHNAGNLTYRCRECRTISDPVYIRKTQQDIQIEIEPPAYARRHLSMPWKLEGTKLDET